ncbi:MAG TPA: GNAT family protein [Thermomicrobiales bacterium]|nr:GNAT family protein [Thermomicrobiales bacterium]
MTTDQPLTTAFPESAGELIRAGSLVQLRTHVPANRAAFQRWYGEPEIARLLRHDLKPLSPSHAALYFDSVILPGSARRFMFAIHENTSAALIGTTGLTDFDYGRPGGCFFRIVIGETASWGHGFGTEATRLVMREAFEFHNRTHVNLEVFSYNERAFRAYHRVGFIQTGEHIEWPEPGGPELHVVEMRLDRERFMLEDRDLQANSREPEGDKTA